MENNDEFRRKKKIIKEKRDNLKEIFINNVFKKYYKIKCLSDTEKEIIINLMKKNKYALQDDNEIKIKHNKSNNNLKNIITKKYYLQ